MTEYGRPEWVVNWIMEVFIEGGNHEEVGYKKFISGRMRNGTAMSYEKKKTRTIPRWRKGIREWGETSEFHDMTWCDFDRASSLICGNKMPTRCNRGIYCRSYCFLNDFGGLGVACWPLVPKFAGSNPAEAVEKKNPQHAFLRRGSKAVGPMS